MLSLEEVRKIERIFVTNNWGVKNFLYHPKQLNLFDAVSEFIANIDTKDRDIAFSLLEKYEIIHEYTKFAQKLCGALNARVDLSKTYYVTPVALPDEGRIKSGHNLCYEIKAFFPKSASLNIHFLDSPFSNKIETDDSSVVVFIDDFVGTGQQFIEMFEAFKCKRGEPKICILLVIRIQEEAFDTLSSMGIQVIADQVRPKAISSGRAVGSLSKEQALFHYLEIEKKVQVPWGGSLGFGQAEAIVTMKRTPDDTLPIFWVDEADGGKPWPAPFPRN